MLRASWCRVLPLKQRTLGNGLPVRGDWRMGRMLSPNAQSVKTDICLHWRGDHNTGRSWHNTGISLMPQSKMTHLGQ